jgi:hypothetical protein
MIVTEARKTKPKQLKNTGITERVEHYALRVL